MSAYNLRPSRDRPSLAAAAEPIGETPPGATPPGDPTRHFTLPVPATANRLAAQAISTAGTALNRTRPNAGAVPADMASPILTKPASIDQEPSPSPTDPDEDEEELAARAELQRQKSPQERLRQLLSALRLLSTVALLVATWYGVAVLLVGWQNIRHGTPLFSLMTVVFFGCVGGWLASLLNGAPLLGMLVAGIVVRNIPGFISPLPVDLTGKLRNIALTVILSRAGIGLQAESILGNARTALMLGTIPVLCEALMNTGTVRALFGYPVSWSFLLGFGMAPISPGVVVPLLLSLREQRRGIRNGLVPMMLAATGLDVVVGITGFSVASSVLFPEQSTAHDPLLQNSNELRQAQHLNQSTSSTFSSSDSYLILHGVIEVFGGLLFGSVLGCLVWLCERMRLTSNIRLVIVLGLSLCSLLGGKALGYAGAASLGCMLTWCVAANAWPKPEIDAVSRKLKLVWEFAQPFLFPIIGAAIDLRQLGGDTVRRGLAVIFVGLLTRMLTSALVLASRGRHMTRRSSTAPASDTTGDPAHLTPAMLGGAGAPFEPAEILFVCGGWTAKATVQAALSYLTIESCVEYGRSREEFERAQQVFTVMILAILCCAPFCATWIQLLGPRCLSVDEFLPTDDPDATAPTPTHDNGDAHHTDSKHSSSDKVHMAAEPSGMALVELARRHVLGNVFQRDK